MSTLKSGCLAIVRCPSGNVFAAASSLPTPPHSLPARQLRHCNRTLSIDRLALFFETFKICTKHPRPWNMQISASEFHSDRNNFDPAEEEGAGGEEMDINTEPCTDLWFPALNPYNAFLGFSCIPSDVRSISGVRCLIAFLRFSSADLQHCVELHKSCDARETAADCHGTDEMPSDVNTFWRCNLWL